MDRRNFVRMGVRIAAFSSEGEGRVNFIHSTLLWLHKEKTIEKARILIDDLIGWGWKTRVVREVYYNQNPFEHKLLFP